MKEIYQKIIEKLFSQEVIDFFTDHDVEPVHFVDLYRGQYQSWENYDVPATPAVFVEFSSDLTDPTQNENTLTVSLHLVYEQVSDTSSLNPQLEDALKFFDFIDLVHSVVKDIQANGTGKLKLRHQENVDLSRPALVHLLTYTTTYFSMLEDIKDQFDYIDVDELNLDEHGKLKEKQDWGGNKFDFHN